MFHLICGGIENLRFHKKQSFSISYSKWEKGVAFIFYDQKLCQVFLSSTQNTTWTVHFTDHWGSWPCWRKQCSLQSCARETHVVVKYFHLCTQSYHDKALKPVVGVWLLAMVWICQTLGSNPLAPTQLERRQTATSAIVQSSRKWAQDECAAILNQWADENLATTASHPAGSDKEGKTWKYLWPLQKGSADPMPNDQDPLVKMIMNIASTQEAILDDHLLLVNWVGLHSCSDYCLRTPRHPEQGLQPNKRVSWMQFGSEFHPRKRLHREPEIVNEHNGTARLTTHEWVSIPLINCSPGKQMVM